MQYAQMFSPSDACATFRGKKKIVFTLLPSLQGEPGVPGRLGMPGPPGRAVPGPKVTSS